MLCKANPIPLPRIDISKPIPGRGTAANSSAPARRTRLVRPCDGNLQNLSKAILAQPSMEILRNPAKVSLDAVADLRGNPDIEGEKVRCQ